MKTSRLMRLPFALIGGLVVLALTLAPSPAVADMVFLDFETYADGITPTPPPPLDVEVGSSYATLPLGPEFGSIVPTDPSLGPIFGNFSGFATSTVVQDYNRRYEEPATTFNIALRFTTGPANFVNVEVISPPGMSVTMTALLDGTIVTSISSAATQTYSKGFLELSGIYFDELQWETSSPTGGAPAIDNLTYGVTGAAELIGALIEEVIGLNLQQGISNSLDEKLDTAVAALDDLNENNDVAACGSLQAFINSVQAQSGNKIPQADADDLIASVQAILDALGCP